MLGVEVVLQPPHAADDPVTEGAPVLGHGLAPRVVVPQVVARTGNTAELLLTPLQDRGNRTLQRVLGHMIDPVLTNRSHNTSCHKS